MAFNDGEQGISGKGNEEQSYDGAGTRSSHAAGDPDSDGSVGSQVTEISAEQAGNEMDEWCSPPASRPEQDDAGLHSPVQSSQLSEEESSQEVLEMAVGKASGQKESKIAKAKRRQTSSSATEVPTAKEGSSKPDQSAHVGIPRLTNAGTIGYDRQVMGPGPLSPIADYCSLNSNMSHHSNAGDVAMEDVNADNAAINAGPDPPRISDSPASTESELTPVPDPYAIHKVSANQSSAMTDTKEPLGDNNWSQWKRKMELILKMCRVRTVNAALTVTN
ncbi:hypothetical protein BC826DRAFT_971540 [Russula brevipes]|nr:hypothetical protein BC826DRAFT_971540 [Russula brevipes]